MATVEDTEDFSDEELEDAPADEDRRVDVGVDDDDDDDDPDGDVPADVDDLLRRSSGPSLSARRRVENYLEMKRAAKDLSDLEDFNFD